MYKRKPLCHHYNDVIMSAMASKLSGVSIACSNVGSSTYQRNIKAPRHWPLCGNSPVTEEFPAQKASTAEDVFVRWRHHGISVFYVQTNHAGLMEIILERYQNEYEFLGRGCTTKCIARDTSLTKWIVFSLSCERAIISEYNTVEYNTILKQYNKADLEYKSNYVLVVGTLAKT